MTKFYHKFHNQDGKDSKLLQKGGNSTKNVKCWQYLCSMYRRANAFLGVLKQRKMWTGLHLMVDRAGGRRNLNASGLASFSQVFQGVMPRTDFFNQCSQYLSSPSK